MVQRWEAGLVAGGHDGPGSGDAAQLVAVAVLEGEGSGDQVLDREGAGWTLHQLRHSLLTHEAETGTRRLLSKAVSGRWWGS